MDLQLIHSGDGGVVVVDAGLPAAADDVAPILKRLPGRVRAIFATHGHTRTRSSWSGARPARRSPVMGRPRPSGDGGPPDAVAGVAVARLRRADPLKRGPRALAAGEDSDEFGDSLLVGGYRLERVSDRAESVVDGFA